VPGIGGDQGRRRATRSVLVAHHVGPLEDEPLAVVDHLDPVVPDRGDGPGQWLSGERGPASSSSTTIRRRLGAEPEAV